MPIMIRNNDATELCITKGQEATVVGWDSSMGPFGQLVLDTLFLKLVDPPKNINVPGLPENVIPMTKSVVNLTCTLTNDMVVSISREQTQVLPNFGMTDYSAQGKTRDWNVVDLTRCRTHMSYYTALSRSSTSEGTVIVKEPDDWSIITKGLSGHLRQEFREIDLLDEITELRYSDQLPPEVDGDVLNSLIRNFQAWKGERYQPKIWHMALKWAAHEQPVQPLRTSLPWQLEIVSPTRKKQKSLKRTQHEIPDGLDQPPNKKVRSEIAAPNAGGAMPRGLLWDAVNWSCGYDAMFTILFDIWKGAPAKWHESFGKKTEIMKELSAGFLQSTTQSTSLENVRDQVRIRLNRFSPENFPYGTRGLSTDNLAEAIIGRNIFCADARKTCLECNYTDLEEKQYRIMNDLSGRAHTICSDCLTRNEVSEMQWVPRLQRVLDLLIVGIQQIGSHLPIEHKLRFDLEGTTRILLLRGVIYFGNIHFTSRIIGSDGRVWFHDGIGTGRACVDENYLDSHRPAFLQSCRGRIPVALVYAEA
ncbi:hypothetical protein DFH09DRAFT_1502328 [Mycena vulgaris]|nr:hypothetical protein DFH09DRAFT_1502328 [Mycena vulgaris]